MMCLFSPDSVGYHYWSGFVLFSLVFWWRAQLALFIWTLNLKKYFLGMRDNLGDFNRNFRLTIASSLITQWKSNPCPLRLFVISWSLTHRVPNQPVGWQLLHVTLRNEERKELSLIPFCPYQQFNRAYITAHSPSKYSHTLEEQCSFYILKERDQMSFLLNILIKGKKELPNFSILPLFLFPWSLPIRERPLSL